MPISTFLAKLIGPRFGAADWRVPVTLLGCAMLIGGAARLFDPQQLAAAGRSTLASHGGLTITAAIGAVLCFFGYSH